MFTTVSGSQTPQHVPWNSQSLFVSRCECSWIFDPGRSRKDASKVFPKLDEAWISCDSIVVDFPAGWSSHKLGTTVWLSVSEMLFILPSKTCWDLSSWSDMFYLLIKCLLICLSSKTGVYLTHSAYQVPFDLIWSDMFLIFAILEWLKHCTSHFHWCHTSHW